MPSYTRQMRLPIFAVITYDDRLVATWRCRDVLEATRGLIPYLIDEDWFADIQEIGEWPPGGFAGWCARRDAQRRNRPFAR